MRALTKAQTAPPPDLHLYITDTLGNPFVEDEQLPQIVEADRRIAAQANRSSARSRSPSSSAIRPTRKRRRARRLDRRAERRQTRGAARSLDAAGRMGRRRARQALQESVRLFLALGDLEGVRRRPLRRDRPAGYDEAGIVCFITVAGFLNGPGFQKMRDDLRRTLHGNLGDRLFARGPSAGRADAHLSGRAAAGLHRARGAKARQR